MRRHRLLLVDDDHAFLNDLYTRIANDPGLEIVGRAHSGREAIERNRNLRPDLVLLGASLPDMSGFEAAAWLKEQRPAPLVLLSTTQASRLGELAAMKVGADACVPKDELLTRLLLVLQELLWPEGSRRIP